MWHNIPGFEDYEITRCGKIRKKSSRREFKFTPDKDSYFKTALRKNGVRHYLRVHRLVAMTFLPNEDNLPLVNHKDGNKQNNHVSNLEWCTYQENVVHGFDVLGRKGYNGGMNKRVAKVDPNTGKILAVYSSMKEASKANGLKSVSINHVIAGRNKTAKGFKWVLVEKSVSTIESVSEN